MLGAKTCPNADVCQPTDTFPLCNSRVSVNSTRMCGRTRASALNPVLDSACTRDCESGVQSMGTTAEVIENAQSLEGHVCHGEDRAMESILRCCGPSFQLKAF